MHSHPAESVPSSWQVDRPQRGELPSGIAVRFRGASFKWDRHDGAACCLRDITASIESGSRVAVVGPVGCGKSAFLASICGGLDLVQGDVRTRQGSSALVQQSPWIQNQTIRANILFGEAHVCHIL